MNDLKTLQALAEQQHEAQNAVAWAEDHLKKMKDNLKHISETLLPEAMEDCDVDEFKTSSGLRISLDRPVRCGKITDPKVLNWLVANGNAGMIKSDVTVAFGRQEKDNAQELIETLSSQGMQARMDEHVHQSTAAAFVRNQLKEGESIDLDFFGAHAPTVAKIEMPK